jgi:hypothetical protein
MANALIGIIRRVPGVFVALLAIAGVMVVSEPGHSATVALAFGAVHVSATPTTGLTDGQAVAVHVEAANGFPMFDVQLHLCKGGVGIKNGFEFDLDGPYCSPYKVSPAADAAVDQRISGTTTADLTFHVGAGTGAPWQETDAGTHTLTCGPGAACDLVAQIAVPNANLFAALPLCFGAGCPPETTPTVPPVAAAGAAASGGQSGGVSTANGAASNSATSANGKGTSGRPGSGVPGADHAGGSAGTAAQAPKSPAGQSAATGAAAPDDVSTALAVPAVATSTPTIATWRIVLAGIAGLLCGARIVSVISRTRRRAAPGIA